MGKKLVIVFILFSSSLFAQDTTNFQLDITDQSLSEVLVSLRDEYNILLSYDHQALSSYRVTLKGEFSSFDEVLNSLLDNLPLRFQKSGEVYIIIQQEAPEEKNEYSITVNVIDGENEESLPFAHVKVNNTSLTTDFSGSFTVKTVGVDSFEVLVSYVGYYIIDTLLTSGRHQLMMRPSAVNLKEIVIEGASVDKYSMSGSEGGNIRLNQKTANYLPGNGDNSIFNLLRLQPGILASGEQSGDMIIWGSYQGQSKIEFDGYTLFGLRNFTENISTVNPFSVKDMRVLKAGYGAEEEGRIGGIVRINGFEGQKDRPHLKFNVNNQTVNGFVSVPFIKSTAFSFAYRQTYLDLLDNNSLEIQGLSGPANRLTTDLALPPDYSYRDMNLKWAGKIKNDQFYISLFQGSDDFFYQVDDEFGANILELDAEEKNDQQAGSLSYNRAWKNGDQTRILGSISDLITSRYNQQLLQKKNPNNPNNFNSEWEESNELKEQKLQLSHTGYWGEANLWKAGVQYIENDLSELFILDTDVINDLDENLRRWGYYLENEFNYQKWRIRAGARLDQMEESYFQPRLSIAYGSIEKIRFSFSLGGYSQFLHRNMAIDENGNIRFFWDLSDEASVPVVTSRHMVAGLSGFLKDFNIRLNLFDKSSEGLSRYLQTGTDIIPYLGESRSRGMDIYVGKEFKGHNLWASYTLSSTTERFDYFQDDNFQRAIQDQRHELKGVALFDFSPFYLSMNYVYGSGLPDLFTVNPDETLDLTYSRFDVSGRVRLKKEKPYTEAGLNILNLFNTQNIKFNDLLRLPDENLSTVSIHTESVPFTATLFLKIIL